MYVVYFDQLSGAARNRCRTEYMDGIWFNCSKSGIGVKPVWANYFHRFQTERKKPWEILSLSFGGNMLQKKMCHLCVHHLWMQNNNNNNNNNHTKNFLRLKERREKNSTKTMYYNLCIEEIYTQLSSLDRIDHLQPHPHPNIVNRVVA